jgi:uncharacterized protein
MPIFQNQSTTMFFLLAFIFSWIFWLPAALSGGQMMDFPHIVLFFLGGFGPSLAGILMISLNYSAGERRDWWRRIIDARFISPAWYMIIFFSFPLLLLVSIGVDLLLGGSVPEFAGLAMFFAQPAIILPSLVSTLLAGPVSEELGWRGFALDKLQSRMSPLVASMVLGFFWWAWHLPLFSFSGTTHYQWGWGTVNFWLFLINIIPLSIFFTWAYNHNSRSILSAIAIHFFYNLVFSLAYPLSEKVELIRTILLFIIVAAIMAWKPQNQTVSGSSKVQP